MRLLLLAILTLVAAPVAADPRPQVTPTVAAPGEAAAPAAPCKMVFVGRGADRHGVCRFTSEIVLTTAAPRPNVLIVDAGARAIVGRPRTADRLADLPRRLP